MCTAVCYAFQLNESNDLPEHFQNYFTLNSSFQEHLSRSHNKLHIPYAETVTHSCQLKTAGTAGPKLWKNIDPTI